MAVSTVKQILPDTASTSKKLVTPPMSYKDPVSGTTQTRAETTYEVSLPASKGYEYLKEMSTAEKFPLNDNDSFKKIRQSGRIKMSTYRNATSSVEVFPMTQMFRAIKAIHPHQAVQRSSGGSSSWYIWFDAGLQMLETRQDRHVTLNDLLNDRPFYKCEMFDQSEIDQALREVKSQVVAETLQSYDLLTDLAELKQTLSLARSIIQSVLNPLSAMSQFANQVSRRSATPGQKAQAITDKWMGYRYGVMPAIYSLQDIMKLVSQLDYVYRTCRAQRVIDCTDSSAPSASPSSKGVYQTVQGTIKIRATSKTRFELGNLSRLIDQTSLNFAQTAWELIPYSFVIDWFANVGDWLLAHTHLTTPGVHSEYCYSIKKEINRDTFVRFYLPSESSSTPGSAAIPAETLVVPALTDVQLAQREIIRSYDRGIFDQGGVDFYVSGPFMSWKRWVDTFSLSLSNLNKALRRLT